MQTASYKGDKIFQRGPNISERFVPGVQIFQQIEINYLGVQIFRYIWIGGTKNGGPLLRDMPYNGDVTLQHRFRRNVTVSF